MAIRKRQAYFVTGTDTDCGKTFVSAALLRAAAQRGHSCLGLKPVAAGGVDAGGQWQNEDALALMEASTVKLSYQEVNPFCLRHPVSPHIAASLEGRRLSLTQVCGITRGSMMQRADLMLVEGAGGWRVPLNEREFLSGVARELGLPAILVVGLRLGCLSHAFLTAEAIRNDGVRLAGWVGTQLDPDMACLDENVRTLTDRFAAPCIGILPFAKDGVADLSGIDLGVILPEA